MSLELDPSLLEAALAGYELQLTRLEAQIAKVRALIAANGGSTRPEANALAEEPARRKVRVISDEARQRIAEAQRLRWAKVRAAKSE